MAIGGVKSSLFRAAHLWRVDIDRQHLFGSGVGDSRHCLMGFSLMGTILVISARAQSLRLCLLTCSQPIAQLVALPSAK